MKRVHVHVILLPGQILVVAGKSKSGEIGNGAVGGVVRRQPLGLMQCERPCGSGYVEIGVKNLLRCVSLRPRRW